MEACLGQRKGKAVNFSRGRVKNILIRILFLNYIEDCYVR